MTSLSELYSNLLNELEELRQQIYNIYLDLDDEQPYEIIKDDVDTCLMTIGLIIGDDI